MVGLGKVVFFLEFATARDTHSTDVSTRVYHIMNK